MGHAEVEVSEEHWWYLLLRDAIWTSGERTQLEIGSGLFLAERAVKAPKCVQSPGASMRLAKNRDPKTKALGYQKKKGRFVKNT